MTKLNEVALAIAAAVDADISPHIRVSKEGALAAARAAIEALREINSETEEAITEQIRLYDSGYDEPDQLALEAWNAAIDAILAEKP